MVQGELKNSGDARDLYLLPYGTNLPEGWRVVGADPQRWAIFTIFQWK